MKEVRINPEHLTREEREQLDILFEKSNREERKRMAEKKQSLMAKIKANLKEFYGKNYSKLSEAVKVCENYSDHMIEKLLMQGYSVCVVPSQDFVVQSPEDFTGHCTIFKVDAFSNIDLADKIGFMTNHSTAYDVYLYLPMYKDLNDDKIKCAFMCRAKTHSNT